MHPVSLTIHPDWHFRPCLPSAWQTIHQKALIRFLRVEPMESVLFEAARHAGLLPELTLSQQSLDCRQKHAVECACSTPVPASA